MPCVVRFWVDTFFSISESILNTMTVSAPQMSRNLWSELKVCFSQQQPQNITALKKICIQEWAKTPATLGQ